MRRPSEALLQAFETLRERLTDELTDPVQQLEALSRVCDARQVVFRGQTMFVPDPRRVLGGGTLATGHVDNVLTWRTQLPETDGSEDEPSTLEAECADLRGRVDALAERVRLAATAKEFLRQTPVVREGDYCLVDGFPTRLDSVSSDGKWTYFNGRNHVEPFRVPPSDSIARLYTAAEVAEIVAKASRV